MGFLDQIADVSDSRQSRYCKVFLATQKHPDLTDEIEEAVHSDYSAVAISKVLKDHGIDIPDSTVKRHRAGLCRCHL